MLASFRWNSPRTRQGQRSLWKASGTQAHRPHQSFQFPLLGTTHGLSVNYTDIITEITSMINYLKLRKSVKLCTVTAQEAEKSFSLIVIFWMIHFILKFSNLVTEGKENILAVAW